MKIHCNFIAININLADNLERVRDAAESKLTDANDAGMHYFIETHFLLVVSTDCHYN